MNSTNSVNAKTVRQFLASNNIKARVRTFKKSIQIARPAYDVEFTPEQIMCFTSFMKDCGFTYVRGLTIEPETDKYLVGAITWEFFRNERV